MKINREDFIRRYQEKPISLEKAQNDPEIARTFQNDLARADQNGDHFISGRNELSALFSRLDRHDRNGDANSVALTNSRGQQLPLGKLLLQLDSAIDNTPSSQPAPVQPAPTRPASPSDLTFTVNQTALQRARNTELGQKAATEVPKHADTYRRASELTGVPAELIAAIHGNESQFGTYRSSSHGPESGFGLDPRYVSTRWAQSKLDQYGLGRWERGTGTARSILQSAVVAGEHLKRQADYAGVTIKSQMNQKELAGAVTSYIQGPSAGERAYDRSRSWVFDPNDNNPHPLHPGGTSVGSGGRIVRVAPERKEGLLRWDALLPLIQEQLRSPR